MVILRKKAEIEKKMKRNIKEVEWTTKTKNDDDGERARARARVRNRHTHREKRQGNKKWIVWIQ